MSEPRLEDMEDYTTLKGEKKRVVWAVILFGILLCIGYVISYAIFDNSGDNIKVGKSIENIPIK